MARGAARGEVEVQDEEFVHHLRRGADLVAHGEHEAAVAALERARDLRPRDPQVLGLLGQALYRLGRFDQAAEAYQRLVDESPVEPSARVNLGLAHLKAKRFPQAVRQLEAALDLSPDHKRAMGYLGLALLEQGDPARARPWFERSGSAHLVAKCDELIAASAAAAASSASAAAAPEEPPAPAGTAAGAASEGSGEPAPAAAAESAPPAANEVAALGAPGEAPGAGGAESPFVTARPLPEVPADATFSIEGGLLGVRVRREVLARAQGLLAVRGALRLAPEMKRFRGRPTEKPFGDGARRLLRASGQGVLLYAAGGRRLLRLPLRGESGYFREEALFALEDGIAFENGRVASRAGPDLHLVHLEGAGEALLATAGEVVTVEVAPDAPVRVRLAALLGWIGALTPKVSALAKGFGAEAGPDAAEPVMVELSGAGRVLLDEGAAG